ncbi:autotransporter outer membrane beta-barrel domain-containing protein [Rhodopirellula sallentina]|nr:autotransporter outer membrane beta-barrel domain-containing protein [Rhodopirellula sallentina]
MKRHQRGKSTRPFTMRNRNQNGRLKRSLLQIALAGVLASTGTYSFAADIEVTSTDDSGEGTLREALTTAVAGDRIVFNLTGSTTITLASDLPVITDDLTFTNSNVAAVTIDRNGFDPLTFTGGVIDLGELNVIAAIGSATDFDFGAASTLIGDGEQITGDIQLRGTIAPGSSATTGNIGKIVIDGQLDADSSTIQMDVQGGATPSSDEVEVTGTTTVDGATLAPNFIGSEYAIGDTFTLLSTGGLSGTLTNATEEFQLPSNPFLEAIINVGANDLGLTIQDNGASFTDVLNECDQLEAAAEMDRLRTAGSGTQQTAINDLRTQSSFAVSSAARQLAGTLYPSLVDAQINEAHNGVHILRDRVLMQRLEVTTDGSCSPWVRAFGMSLDTGEDHCPTEGYRREIAGVELGTGYFSTAGLGFNGFVQLGSADTTVVDDSQLSESDFYRVGGSVQYVGDVCYALGTGGFGFHQHSIARSMSALQSGTSANNELDSDDQFVSVEIGTFFETTRWLWSSFASVQAAQANLDGGSETGDSDFLLNTSSIDGESLRSMLGGTLTGSNLTGLGNATTQVRLGWLHEYLDHYQTVVSTVQDGGQAMTIQSADTGRDWLSLGAQLDWGVILGGQFTLAYQANLNTQSTFQSGMVGGQWYW